MIHSGLLLFGSIVNFEASVAALTRDYALSKPVGRMFAAPTKLMRQLRVETGGEEGISLNEVDSLHLGSAFGGRMLAYPLFRAGGYCSLGLAAHRLCPACLLRHYSQAKRGRCPMGLPIYHLSLTDRLPKRLEQQLCSGSETTVRSSQSQL